MDPKFKVGTFCKVRGKPGVWLITGCNKPKILGFMPTYILLEVTNEQIASSTAWRTMAEEDDLEVDEVWEALYGK